AGALNGVHLDGLQAGGRLRHHDPDPPHPAERHHQYGRDGEALSLEGVITYAIFFATMAGIYAILSLGLNIQWGYTGLFNIGIAGFFAVGAYTSAILTTAPSPTQLGGFNLPFIVGFLAAGILSGVIALLIG